MPAVLARAVLARAVRVVVPVVVGVWVVGVRAVVATGRGAGMTGGGADPTGVRAPSAPPVPTPSATATYDETVANG